MMGIINHSIHVQTHLSILFASGSQKNTVVGEENVDGAERRGVCRNPGQRCLELPLKIGF